MRSTIKQKTNERKHKPKPKLLPVGGGANRIEQLKIFGCTCFLKVLTLEPCKYFTYC